MPLKKHLVTTLLVKLSILAKFPEDSPVSDRGVLSKCMWHVSRVAAQNRFGRRRQVSGNCMVSLSTEFVDTSWLQLLFTEVLRVLLVWLFHVGVLARGSNASSRIHVINMIMWKVANGNLVKNLSLLLFA